MAQVKVGGPHKVFCLDWNTANLKLPSLDLHLADVLPLGALSEGRLRHTDLVEKVVDVTHKVVELTIETSAEKRVVDTEVPLLLLLPSQIGVDVLRLSV